MGHTPYGYKIENGKAVIDETAARKLRTLFDNYLNGISLQTAAKAAGIETYHGTVKRIITTKHYIGDEFYPALIDEVTFDKAQEELYKRAAALGRLNMTVKKHQIEVHTRFSIPDIREQFNNPKQQAEYLYSIIECEV